MCIYIYIYTYLSTYRPSVRLLSCLSIEVIALIIRRSIDRLARVYAYCLRIR